ncbi:hypothetical protein C8R43DRAFT_994997 [Mycena crocata]|nr:hypothetical protein C8R43DRAFT_994997 [Mycena crocata]
MWRCNLTVFSSLQRTFFALLPGSLSCSNPFLWRLGSYNSVLGYSLTSNAPLCRKSYFGVTSGSNEVPACTLPGPSSPTPRLTRVVTLLRVGPSSVYALALTNSRSARPALDSFTYITICPVNPCRI